MTTALAFIGAAFITRIVDLEFFCRYNFEETSIPGLFICPELGSLAMLQGSHCVLLEIPARE
ncbi:hypothetical protein [Desulfocurvibacter africanus]|uniref:hypothetical protein n=1 Tax=Desulfocurvibacter africanus TaxID=873 RepID=UPI0003FE7019|nr:hypothetical protein [Desulfocurvibacter africanus]